jgi:Ca-activated chloride channel family protein
LLLPQLESARESARKRSVGWLMDQSSRSGEVAVLSPGAVGGRDREILGESRYESESGEAVESPNDPIATLVAPKQPTTKLPLLGTGPVPDAHRTGIVAQQPNEQANFLPGTNPSGATTNKSGDRNSASQTSGEKLPSDVALLPAPVVAMARSSNPVVHSPTPAQLRRENGRIVPGPDVCKPSAPPNTEAYNTIVENPFLRALDTPLSTFSIDVDTASYSNVRRYLNAGQLPPRDAVRIEELLNYFIYAYPQPKTSDPFGITTEAVRCPWNAEHVLVRVGLKGREMPRTERPASNLVFLVDVSGSMQQPDKLPLVRESLKMLVRELSDRDRVAIVVYAGSTGLVLPSTGVDRKADILKAIEKLEAGGSTNGAAGIELAYQVAVENFIPGGVNRVILATDGDFNVGVTSPSELVRLIETKAKSKVFFSGLAYGTGNLKDATLEQLADKGNGNYAYIDSLAEARKVLVEQMSGTLVTIAKDVKVQIEFNPNRVAAYRLIGYENRMLAAQDFNDDKKDAGEIGAGHSVTALYELIPADKTTVVMSMSLPAIDPLKYQKPKIATEPTDAAKTDELLTLKLRYKQPDGKESKLIQRPLKGEVKEYGKASGDFKFAASVAAFGMLLRESEHRGTATFDGVLELAVEAVGKDTNGYRREFLDLVRKARELSPQTNATRE